MRLEPVDDIGEHAIEPVDHAVEDVGGVLEALDRHREHLVAPRVKVGGNRGHPPLDGVIEADGRLANLGRALLDRVQSVVLQVAERQLDSVDLEGLDLLRAAVSQP